MTDPRPLNPAPTQEVPLPQAPLVRVLAQARFPTILAIRSADRVADLQETLRKTYPNLSQDQVHSIRLGSGETPDVHADLIWRLADREKNPDWRVSLGVDFVTLETSNYESRTNFLDRLRAVLFAVEQAFDPASASRLGLRYIDRLEGEAFERVQDLIHPGVLGIIRPDDSPQSELADSVIQQITETQFQATNGARVQARWGKLPRHATYDSNALETVQEPSWVLDFDMFTTESQPFISEELVTTAKDFAECLYWLFRQMVTVEFLKFHGGEP